MLPGYYRRLTLVLLLPLTIAGLWLAGYVYKESHRRYVGCDAQTYCGANYDQWSAKSLFTDSSDNSFSGLQLHFQDVGKNPPSYNQESSYDVFTHKQHLELAETNSENFQIEIFDRKILITEDYPNHKINLILGSGHYTPRVYGIKNQVIFELKCNNLIIPLNLNSKFKGKNCSIPQDPYSDNATVSFIATPEFISWASKIKSNYEYEVRNKRNKQQLHAILGFITPFISYILISFILFLLVKTIRYIAGK